MTIPTRTLKAAGRWLNLLRGGSYTQAKSFLWNDTQYADLTRDQYDRGFDLLKSLGMYVVGVGLRQDLAEASGDQLRLFLATDAVAADAPPWIEDSVVEAAIVDPPAEVMAMVAALDLDADYASEVIRRAYVKVDIETRAAVGAAGEAALMDLLRQSGVDSVEQVSAYDDGAGFDLRATVSGTKYHLEVKSTTKMRSLRVFLSRNEYEVFTRDPSWMLVAVGLDNDFNIAALATVDQGSVRDNVPLDKGPVGRWSSCQLLLSGSHLTRGLQLGRVEVDGSSSNFWWT